MDGCPTVSPQAPADPLSKHSLTDGSLIGRRVVGVTLPRGDSEKVQPGNLEKQAEVMRDGQWAGDSRDMG